MDKETWKIVLMLLSGVILLTVGVYLMADSLKDMEPDKVTVTKIISERCL